MTSLLWQCQHKRHHPTEELALEEARRLADLYHEPFVAYPCLCREYQVGHPIGWEPTARRLEWARRAGA